MTAAAKMTRSRTYQEHGTLKQQLSTHIQMIVSATEASNKELKGNKGARETMPRENLKTRETLQAIVEEFVFFF